VDLGCGNKSLGKNPKVWQEMLGIEDVPEEFPRPRNSSSQTDDPSRPRASSNSGKQMQQHQKDKLEILYPHCHDGSIKAQAQDPQRVKWTIRGVQVNQKRGQVEYRGIVVPPGRYLQSPRFTIAGLEGSLRFWPNGYFSSASRSERRDTNEQGSLNANSWCAVGLDVPSGNRLRLRFFCGNEMSEVRQVYWDSTGNVVKQVWMPHASEPPASFADGIVVGVEVLTNLREIEASRRRPLKSKAAVARAQSASAQGRLGRTGSLSPCELLHFHVGPGYTASDFNFHKVQSGRLSPPRFADMPAPRFADLTKHHGPLVLPHRSESPAFLGLEDGRESSLSLYKDW